MRNVILWLIFVLFTALFNSCGDAALPEPDAELPPVISPVDFNITDTEPAWSPDGEWIAFVHAELTPGAPGIYLISPDGQRIQQWHEGFAQTPAWSPDAQWIVFSENAQIWKKKINGDSLSQLTFEGRNFFPAWSPDGNLIAHSQSICTHIPCGLWLINLDGPTHFPITLYGNFPSFDPVNGTILYRTRWVDNSEVYGDSLFYYDHRIGRSTFLMTLQELNHGNKYFKINSDGSRIAFTSQSRYGPSIQIWTMKTDGSDLKQLTHTLGYSCDWSPDGKYIVYTDASRESGRLWIMDADGSNKRQLTFEHHF